MIVEGLTEKEIMATLAALDLSVAVGDELGAVPGDDPRRTAQTKLFVTLGTRLEALSGMASCN